MNNIFEQLVAEKDNLFIAWTDLKVTTDWLVVKDWKKWFILINSSNKEEIDYFISQMLLQYLWLDYEKIRYLTSLTYEEIKNLNKEIEIRRLEEQLYKLKNS